MADICELREDTEIEEKLLSPFQTKQNYELQFGLYLIYKQDIMRSLNSVETLLGKMDFHTFQREVQIGVSCLNGNVLMCISTLKHV